MSTRLCQIFLRYLTVPRFLKKIWQDLVGIFIPIRSYMILKILKDLPMSQEILERTKYSYQMFYRRHGSRKINKANKRFIFGMIILKVHARSLRKRKRYLTLRYGTFTIRYGYDDKFGRTTLFKYLIVYWFKF